MPKVSILNYLIVRFLALLSNFSNPFFIQVELCKYMLCGITTDPKSDVATAISAAVILGTKPLINELKESPT